MEQQETEKAAKAINAQIADSDPNEGEIIAVKYTMDGEILIVRENGKDIEKAIPTAEFKGLPKKWRGQHTEAMASIAYLIGEAKKIKAREMPLTRQECIDYGVNKTVIKALEKMGMITQRLITMKDAKTKKSVGGKMIIYFTPYGRSYMENLWKAWGESKDDSVPSKD